MKLEKIKENKQKPELPTPKVVKFELKIVGSVHFIDGGIEVFNNVSVIRHLDKSIMLLKDKLPNTHLYSSSVEYPLSVIKKVESKIVKVSKVE